LLAVVLLALLEALAMMATPTAAAPAAPAATVTWLPILGQLLSAFALLLRMLLLRVLVLRRLLRFLLREMMPLHLGVLFRR
jgi:hypothetical protein